MQYAIIAAGEGSRLSQEGVAVPKPLVKVGGECLIDRLIKIFLENGAASVSMICRPDKQVEDHLRQRQQEGVPLQYIVKSTSSSMHSMYELSSYIKDDEPFVLTTVDTVFREKEFSAYVAALEKCIQDGDADGLMGVTDYVDDECPLYVTVDEKWNIGAFLDRDDSPRYVSAGVYGLTPRSLTTLRDCVSKGEHRMRNFQRALLSDGMRLKAWPLGTVFDIDHAADVAKANQFLEE